MTPKRWQLVGGYSMGLLFIVAVNMIQADPLSWYGVLIAVAAGVLGNAVGSYIVREWQDAR